MSAGVYTGLEAALEAIAAGRIVVIAGDRLRGGDIDLMIAAKHVTPEAINFMATHGRGLICLAVTPERAARLGLQLAGAALLEGLEHADGNADAEIA